MLQPSEQLNYLVFWTVRLCEVRDWQGRSQKSREGGAEETSVGKKRAQSSRKLFRPEAMPITTPTKLCYLVQLHAFKKYHGSLREF